MAKEKYHGSTKRFGPRYGRTLKRKLDKIESIQKGKHKCPYCHAEKVKRLNLGIWKCGKCDSEFTGRAYTTAKQVRTKKVQA